MPERGRPQVYTKEIFDEICNEVGEGTSLRKVLNKEGMPRRITFYRWLREHPELCNQYARAKEDRADTYVDDIIDIADNEVDPQRAKVRIDARKWIACKLHPRNYSDKREEEEKEKPVINLTLNK